MKSLTSELGVEIHNVVRQKVKVNVSEEIFNLRFCNGHILHHCAMTLNEMVYESSKTTPTLIILSEIANDEKAN